MEGEGSVALDGAVVAAGDGVVALPEVAGLFPGDDLVFEEAGAGGDGFAAVAVAKESLGNDDLEGRPGGGVGPLVELKGGMGAGVLLVGGGEAPRLDEAGELADD